MSQINLTTEQKAALKKLSAEKGNNRLYISRTQIGMGGNYGEPAYGVVYSIGAKKPWQVRSKADLELMAEMKKVI